MTEKQLRHFEQRLLRERERALRAFRRIDEDVRTDPLKDDGDLTSYPVHLADEGTDTMEQEKEFVLLSKEGRLIYWIDEALRTLYQHPEDYGRCPDCGARIAPERLDIIPWAKLCLECQRTDEMRQAQVSEAA